MKTKNDTDMEGTTTMANKNDIDMAIARATRILVDAGADFCVVGVDDANKISTGMSPSFGAAVGRVEYKGKDEDGKFRFSYLIQTLEIVANVLTGAEIEHRQRHGIPMTDTFDIDESEREGFIGVDETAKFFDKRVAEFNADEQSARVLNTKTETEEK